MNRMWLKCLVMAIAVATLCGCRNASENQENKASLKLEDPVNASQDGTKIRFDSEKKDEYEQAMEKASEEWNRNLILRNGR